MRGVTAKQRSRTSSRKELGIFANFSPIIHGTARIRFPCESTDAQHILLEVLKELNGHEEPRILSIADTEGEVSGRMGFEIGVGEGNYFVYLDEDTTADLIALLKSRRRPRPLDFLLILTYHYKKDGINKPLKFDYHQLRFLFGQKLFDVILHHVKGTRRVPLDELLMMFLNRFDQRLQKLRLGSAKIEYIRTA
jgi:hypothetical protein